MAELRINSAVASNMENNVDSVTIEQKSTDGVSSLDETEYVNSNWTKWNGIYKTIPEVKTAIDMRAIWTIGKGFKADPETTVILDHVTGWGTDTFNSILKNMLTIKRVAGDSFAEIMRADDGTLINLKPLDPGSIRIVVDRKGIVKRYEQINKNSKKNETVHVFKPNEIFHLSNKRIADEIHGVSDIEAVEQIILANNESFTDMKQVMHYHVKPRMAFMIDSDDPTKIEEFAGKMDAAINKGENIYIPKGTVEFELISVPSNSTLNPLPWREHLRSYFFQVVGIPQIILGSSGEFTESTAKIAYLAFEQSVDDEQNETEAQFWEQVGLRIELSFPASLRNELLSDEAKDANQGMEFQPGDTTAGVAE